MWWRGRHHSREGDVAFEPGKFDTPVDRAFERADVCSARESAYIRNRLVPDASWLDCCLPWQHRRTLSVLLSNKFVLTHLVSFHSRSRRVITHVPASWDVSWWLPDVRAAPRGLPAREFQTPFRDFEALGSLSTVAEIAPEVVLFLVDILRDGILPKVNKKGVKVQVDDHSGTWSL